MVLHVHVDEESYFEKISESVHREARLGKIAEGIVPDKFVVLLFPHLKKGLIWHGNRSVIPEMGLSDCTFLGTRLL